MSRSPTETKKLGKASDFLLAIQEKRISTIPDDFDSSDLEFSPKPKPFPNAGKASIESMRRHIERDRIASQLRVDKLNAEFPSPPVKKRKVDSVSKGYNADDEDDFTGFGAQDALAGIESKPKRARKKKDEEKRLRVFRKKAPLSYLERLNRVKTQRMFLIDRKRSSSADGTHEEEIIDIAGTTGNIYQVTITKQPHCTCPDGGKGNQCKHIIYVMVNVLKAREDFGYQLALLSTELAEIFANAPPLPSQTFGEVSTSTDTGGQRKPIEGDCPVCVMEFDAGEDVIWCKGACGNNVHRECFEKWAKSKQGEVCCVYCRTPWKGDDDTIKRIAKGGVGSINHEGYVNVGRELGLSGSRDLSTYHQYWVRREFG